MEEEKTYAEVAGWMRARLSFASLRATNVCLQGSRTKWRSGTGFDDGADYRTLHVHVEMCVCVCVCVCVCACVCVCVCISTVIFCKLDHFHVCTCHLLRVYCTQVFLLLFVYFRQYKYSEGYVITTQLPQCVKTNKNVAWMATDSTS